MKTTKEKAIELYSKYSTALKLSGGFENEFKLKEYAKQCTLITVDEIIRACDPMNCESDDFNGYCVSWWQKVKQEIEKL